MLRSASGYICLFITFSGMMYGCSKSSLTHSNGVSSNTTANTSVSYFTTDPSKSPYYGDSILYVQGAGRSAYLFSPVNSLGAGKYVAWPSGLTIDEVTGVIDVLQSEPGSRYNVGFIKAGTNDTTYNQVILAGITYPDGIYYMDSKDSVLIPYYNASSYAPWIAGSGLPGNNNIDNGVFDEDGAAGLRANDQQLKVNNAEGSINLKNSVRSGLFGSNPQNGDSKEISIYYRLNDNSKMNLQKTSLIVHYYNTITDVPTDLINTCLSSQVSFLQVQVAGSSVSLNTGNKSVDATTPVPAGPSAKSVPITAPSPCSPRPPQVVIVNSGHH